MELRHGKIVLVGFMGTGKSSVGRRLSVESGMRFVDLDQLIVSRDGRPITAIFEQAGEEAFRDLESAALESLQAPGSMILATGGGVVTRPENVSVLRELGFVVGLTASEEVIFERVSRNGKRPLLKTPNPRETIARLLAVRRPLYEAAAHWSIDTSHASHAEVTAEISREATRFFATRE